MNKQKRQRLVHAQSLVLQAHDIVEDVLDDERVDFDNLPESLQESERGQKMEEAIDALDSAISSITEASGYIDDAIN